MKTNIYILSLIAIFAWGCSKKTEVAVEEPKYDVTFTVSGIESSTDKITPNKQQSLFAASNPHDVVGNVNLYVYNGEGNLVAQVNEPCCGTADGIMIEGLEAGPYTAIAVGDWYSETMDLHSLSTARLIHSVNDIYNGEVYLDRVDFEVINVQNNHVNLILQRKVGLLIVDITDDAPSDVSYVRATVRDLAYQYHFDEFMPLHDNYDVTFEHSDPYIEFGGYYFVPENRTSFKTSVLLEVIGINGEVLKSKWVYDVTVGTNIKTTLRGKLYEPNAQGFTIEIDTEWSGEKTVDF